MKLLPEVTTDMGEFCMLNKLSAVEALEVLIHLTKIVGCCSTEGVIWVRFLLPRLLLHELLHHLFWQFQFPRWFHRINDRYV